MTTLNNDYLLTKEECKAATDQWNLYLSNFPELKNIIHTNYIFDITKEHLDWMRINSGYQEFCAAAGVHEKRLILIFYPMDGEGAKKELNEYAFCFLCELEKDLKLQEIQEYTIVKNAILSKDLQKVEKDADMGFPISNKPVLEQSVALEAIERWRDEGIDWFYRECVDYKGLRIFKKFYVPTEDLCLNDPGLTAITCSFGLKYNDIYERMLVTLIFISFREDLQNAERAQMISNTYDWAKPCPPVCRIPEVEL